MRSGSVTAESNNYNSRRGKEIDPTDPLFAEDGPLVGTPAMLSSPNVMEPPIGNHGRLLQKNVPTPSLYHDKRGDIYNLELSPNKKRVKFLYTHKGTMRCGDLYCHKHCLFVLEGSVELWLPQPDGSTEKTLLKCKDFIEILPYVPHIKHFVEDAIHVEWWESEKKENIEWKHWYYAPYRRLVDASFGWVKEGGARGKLVVLKGGIHDDDDDNGSSLLEKDQDKEKESRGVLSGNSFLTGVIIGALAAAISMVSAAKLKK